MKRSTVIKLAVLGFCLIGVGLGLWVWQHETSPHRLREAVDKNLSRLLDAQLKIGDVSFNLPGILRIRHLQIVPPGQERPFLEVPEVRLELDGLGLLRFKKIPRGLVLVGPVLELAYSEERGQWNVESVELKRVRGKELRGFEDGVAVSGARIYVDAPPFLSHGRAFVLSGIDIVARPAPGSDGTWHLEGIVRELPLSGLRVTGWLRPGESLALQIEGDMNNLMLDRELQRSVPYVGEKLWDMFQLRGPLNWRGSVSLSPQGSSLEYDLDLYLDGVESKTKYSPVTLKALSGPIKVRSSKVSFGELKGIIGAGDFVSEEPGALPVGVGIEGVWDFETDDLTLHLDATAVPLSARSLESVPKVGRKLYEELRPAGRADFSLRYRESHDSGRPVFSSLTELRDASFQPSRFPFSLEHVGGTIHVDERWVRLEGVSGMVVRVSEAAGLQEPQVGHFRVDGAFDMKRELTALRARFEDLLVDKELLSALPDGGAHILGFCRPEIDVTGDVRVKEYAGSGGLEYAADLVVNGGRASLDPLPFPLTDMKGSLSVKGQRVLWDISGLLDYGMQSTDQTGGSALLRANGQYDIANRNANIHLETSPFLLGKELLGSLPGVGEELWETARPQGWASAKGRMTYVPDREPELGYLFELAMNGLSLNLTPPGLPISSLSGNLLVSEQRVVSNDLRGICCGGTFDAVAELSYGEGREEASFAGTVKFGRVGLGRVLEALTGGPVKADGLVGGTVEIGGSLPAREGLVAEGAVRVSEAGLWRTPFFVKLLDVLQFSMPSPEAAVGEAQMSFSLSNGQIAVHEFLVTGGGLEVTGYGTVGLNGDLSLHAVAATVPGRDKGIPILTPAIGMILRGVQRKLFNMEITGTIDKPEFKTLPWRVITGPFGKLFRFVTSPFRKDSENDEGGPKPPPRRRVRPMDAVSN